MLESVVCTGATLAGPWLFLAGFRALRVKQLIESTPTARVRSMAMGMVEIHGKLTPRSRVVGPFSGRPCCYWEVEIQTRSNSRNNSYQWHTVHKNRSGHPFFLHDETGVALVYPQGGDIRTPFGVEEATSGFGVPDCYSQYMEENHLGMRAIWALGPMRFRERTLEEGASVYVLGRAYPRAMASNVSWDEEALQATGTDAIGATRVRSLDHDVQGVIRRGPGDPAFLISPQSEKVMSMEYGLKAFGGVIGGPLVTLFGVWCLLELAKSGQLFR